MAFCGSCGTQVQDGVRFCPTCGNDLAAAQDSQVQQAAPIQPTPEQQYQAAPQQWQQAPQPQQYQDPYQQQQYQQAYQQPYQQAPPNDAQANKGMAILAYIIFFVPLIAGTHKTSPFVKFHTNQGTVLALFGIGANILYIIPFLGWVIAPLLSIAVTVLAIIGIINASKGEMKQLPVIGKMTLIK